MSKPVMKVPFMGYWLTVDRIGGYGSEHADLALRESTEKGAPGKRVKALFGAKRADLIGMAFNLLDVADAMQPDSTYATSDSVHSGKGESIPAHAGFNQLRKDVRPLDIDEVDGRKRDVAERFEKLRKRMPTLQLAQRVSERCNDDVAQTIACLLIMADQTGDLPVRVGMGMAPSPEAMEAMAEMMESADPNKIKH